MNRKRTFIQESRMKMMRLAYLFQQIPEDDSLVTSLMKYLSRHMVTVSSQVVVGGTGSILRQESKV